MPRSRKRSKSVGDKKTKKELEFSLNLKLTKTKAPTHFVGMTDKEQDLEFMRCKNTELSDELNALKKEHSKLKSSTDNERISLRNDKRKCMEEKNKVILDFKNERKELEMKIRKEENDRLKSKLDDERQRQEEVIQSVKLQLSKQAEEFDKEKKKIEGERYQINKEREEYWNNVQKDTNTIQKSRGNILFQRSFQNVQIVSKIITDDQASQKQELIDKLTLSINEQITKQKEFERTMRKCYIMLHEMQDSIKKIVNNLEKSKSKLSKEDRELLIFLTEDRSDEHVITEGIKTISQIRKDKKNLPLSVDAMVERLLNTLGSITCGKFVQILEGRKHTLYKEMVPADTDQTEVKGISIKSELDDPLLQFDNDIPLDKCLCVEILSNWLLISEENDHLKLLGKLEAYESRILADCLM